MLLLPQLPIGHLKYEFVIVVRLSKVRFSQHPSGTDLQLCSELSTSRTAALPDDDDSDDHDGRNRNDVQQYTEHFRCALIIVSHTIVLSQWTFETMTHLHCFREHSLHCLTSMGLWACWPPFSTICRRRLTCRYCFHSFLNLLFFNSFLRLSLILLSRGVQCENARIILWRSSRSVVFIDSGVYHTLNSREILFNSSYTRNSNVRHTFLFSTQESWCQPYSRGKRKAHRFI